MSRKVFISVLGTGFYGKCQYEHHGFTSSNTRFIQQATLEWLEAKKWDKNDIAYFLLTDEARSSNWKISNGRRFNNYTKVEEEYQDLESIVKGMELPFHVEGVSIPKGKDENEIWEIFDIVYHLLNDGDLLYVDMTHGYRYLPMFMLVLGNYSKFLKNVKVSSLSYGNYEERKDNKAPIISLMPFSTLQDWTFATANFKENGYSQKLFQLSKGQLETAYKKSARPDLKDVTLNNCLASLSKIVDQRLTCRGLDVIGSKDVKKACNQLDSIEVKIKPQFIPLIEEMKAALKGFNTESDIRNLFSAARWCFKKHLYQQAVTFLEEGVISFFCSRHGINYDDREKRELVTSAFKIKVMNTPIEEQRVKHEEWRPILESILNDELLSKKELVNSVSDLVDFRNDYNHCGMRVGAMPAKRIKDKTNNFISTITNILYPSTSTTDEQSPDNSRLFLNLTNHPSALWEAKQLAAAGQYGTVEDMPFPDISPEATDRELLDLAEKTAEEILQKAEGADLTLHVMGEMSFTYRLVSLLKAEGITCVASTSERIAEEQDGVKTSEFRFVKFREY